MNNTSRSCLVITDETSTGWLDRARAGSGEQVHWDILPLGISSERYVKNQAHVFQVLVCADVVDLSPYAERAQESLKSFYLRFIYRLPRTPLWRGRTLFSELATSRMNLWWCLEISEKNPYRATLIFQRLYFVALVGSILKDRHFDEIWLSLEDRSLSFVLERSHPALPIHDVYSKRDSKVSISQRFLTRFLSAAFQTFRRAAGLFLLALWARIGPRSATSSRFVMLFTFYPLLWDKPYGKVSRDIMYGDLKEALQRKTDVCYGAWINVRLREAWRHRADIKCHFASNGTLALNRLCHVSDFLRAWSPLRLLKVIHIESRLVPQIHAIFEGVDVSLFVQEEMRRSFCRPEFFTNELIASAVSRSIDRYKISAIIHYLEFQMFEKAIWYGAQDRAKTIGFQHSTIGKNKFLYLFSPEEIVSALDRRNPCEAMPVPDLIFTSGRYPLEVLRQNGIPEHRLAVCGAVRYAGLASRITQIPEKERLRQNYGISLQARVLLVAPSSESREGAIDLVRSVAQAVPERAHDVLVVVKCHPMLPIDLPLIRAAAADRPSVKIKLVPPDAPLLDFMWLADAVFQTASSTAVEAAALGRIAIIYENPATLTLGPVADVSRIGLMARNDKEMRCAVNKVLTGDVSLDVLRKTSKREVDEVFSYLDGTASDRFIQLLRKFGVLAESRL